MRPVLLTALALAALTAVAASAATAAPERIPVLIAFERPPGEAELAMVRRAGGRIEHRYGIVPAVAALVPEAAVPGLLRTPGVTVVEPDQRVYGLDYRATHDWGIAHIRADQVHAAGNTGTSTGGRLARVGVLDSGIDCEHVELPPPRCVLGPTFIEGTASSDDDWAHGTHVAGTVAAERNADTSTGVVGVAPSVQVTAYKILDSDGVGSISDVAAALDAVWNGGDPREDVVNMSVGWSSGSSTLQAAVDRAYASGVVLVAAAGNGGNCGGRGNSVSYPARYDSVIAVAAVDSANERPCWSSTGDQVELAAPGVSVFSTWPHDISTSWADPPPVCEAGICHYKYGSGTSMSAPHVAGAAALVIASESVADVNGANGPADEVRERLALTAVDIGSAGRDPRYGFGLVDALAAVQAGDDGASEPPPNGEFSLTANGYKIKGAQTVDLAWSGASSDNVDVYRSGADVATTPNDGAHTDDIGQRGGGSYTYQLCESGTSTCSNEVTVVF